MSILALLISAALANGVRVEIVQDLRWRNISPAIMGGRIDDLEALEADPDTIDAGAATGGMWKSVNVGTTWTSIFDDYGTTSIGDLAIAPSDPKTVWVGTGEAKP